MITAAEWGRSASWGEYRRRKRFALRCRAGHASLDSLMRRIPIFAARSDGTLAPRSHGPRPMPFFCRSPPRFAAGASTATRSAGRVNSDALDQPTLLMCNAFDCAEHLASRVTKWLSRQDLLVVKPTRDRRGESAGNVQRHQRLARFHDTDRQLLPTAQATSIPM